MEKPHKETFAVFPAFLKVAVGIGELRQEIFELKESQEGMKRELECLAAIPKSKAALIVMRKGNAGLKNLSDQCEEYEEQIAELLDALVEQRIPLEEDVKALFGLPSTSPLFPNEEERNEVLRYVYLEDSEQGFRDRKREDEQVLAEVEKLDDGMPGKNDLVRRLKEDIESMKTLLQWYEESHAFMQGVKARLDMGSVSDMLKNILCYTFYREALDEVVEFLKLKNEKES